MTGIDTLAGCSICMQYACMVNITIRNVPDEARDVLARRAASSGRSLQEYLRGLLVEVAGRADADEVVDRMARRVHAHQTSLPSESILRARDDERR